jgi:hypothetical protein
LTNTFTKPKLTNKEQKNFNMDYKALYEQQLAENKKLQGQVTYLEDEVCRYSNAIEIEYVLKTDYDELQEENKELQEANDNWEADDANLTKIIYMVNGLDEDFSVSGVDDLYECIKELKEEYEAAEEALTIVKEENETNKKNLQKFMNQAKLWETTAKNIEEKKEEETEDIEKLLKENEELKKKILAR